jgi:hypothetical protein
VEPELPTFPGILRSPPVFSKVRIARYLVLCVIFCRSLFVHLSFGHCVVCPSSILFTASDYPFGICWPMCCLSFHLIYSF